MKSLAIVLFVVFLSGALGEITSDGCGKTKNCYQFPENCDPNTAGCRFISWRPSSKDDQKYKFEMSGTVGGGDRYISFGLALISDMKDSDMYYCDGRELGAGVIDARRVDPTYLPLGDDITEYSARTVNGVAQCKFTRSASITRDISEGAHHEFDIANHKYFLLVAVGDMKDKKMVQHDWRVHLHDSYNFSQDPQWQMKFWATLQKRILQLLKRM